MLDAKEPKFNLANDVSEINVTKSKNYNKSVVKISEIELKKHKEFLKTELKKNFYWTFLILYSFSKSTVSLTFTSLNPEFSNKKQIFFLIQDKSYSELLWELSFPSPLLIIDYLSFFSLLIEIFE